MKSFFREQLAPCFYGAIFLLGGSFLTSCDKKGSQSAENVLPTIEESISENSATVAASAVENRTIAQTTVADVAPQPSAAPPVSSTAASGLRFLAYNVENWLIMEDRYDFDTRKSSKNAPKPEKERASVISIVASEKPDVFGVCEIGAKTDLLEIQASLKAAGLDLPHMHFTGGQDTTRHLGILSRYPIITTAEPAEKVYKLNGKDYQMQRGILDATIKTPDGRSWRFLGVHLKSKRDVEDGDQEQMRINEAQLLRKHIDSIIAADPKARLLCYGDFNDTRGTSTIRIVTGPNNSPRNMMPIGVKDSRGLYWTHFWAKEDVYSRFDYIFVSQDLKNDVSFQDCKILDPENWNDASDHRAVLGVFR
jgi:endonuclease/exonuclease/phosphatase family metal-dependent hydrolase